MLDYFYEDSEIEDLFKNIHSSLSPGGLAIIDYIDEDFFKTRKPKPTILEGVSGDLRSFRASFPELDPEKLSLKLDFRCTIFMDSDIVDYFEEVHLLRIFSFQQISAILRNSGLSIVTKAAKGFNTRILARKQ